jgi:putative tricarboxylic transport membrane protein
MSLGIPGGATTAVIMGALIIHGLTPGPMLFVRQPEFVYSTFIILAFCMLIMLFIGMGMIRVANFIVRIPAEILFPIVLIFATFGSYAIRNSMIDVIAMYLIGVVGFFMRIHSIPPAPLAIAFILGPFFEENLRRSLLMSSGSPEIFLRSWIAVLFLVLAVVSAAAAVFVRRRGVGEIQTITASRRSVD